MNTRQNRDEEATLALLEAVEQESQVSQRKLASQMGVALGLANSYLKRCIRKGWIKISDAPANRYLYYITPKGFSEKSRLTAKYLANSLHFYRKARTSCADLYAKCHENGHKRVLLCGLSDLAEIAILEAMECDMEVVGVYQPDTDRSRLLGKPVWNKLSEAGARDVCVLTELNDPKAFYLQLLDVMGDGKLLTPNILSITPTSSN